jgi:hypothetical protein
VGDRLNDKLDAIVATSDLQGIVPDPRTGDATLLGVAVAEALEELTFDDVLPPAGRIGVVLAGDLYSVPTADKRGGFGDVASVWHAFARLTSIYVDIPRSGRTAFRPVRPDDFNYCNCLTCSSAVVA